MTGLQWATMARRAARGRALLAFLLGCSILSGCAVFRGRTVEARTIAVDLPISRTDAARRTLAAFREQGYQIRATLTSGLEPETEPFRQGDEAEVVFRAVLSGSDQTSRVVLSGTYRRLHLRGTVRGREQEVRNSDDALERALWSRLDELRRAIERPSR